jgi:hypothetical protein
MHSFDHFNISPAQIQDFFLEISKLLRVASFLNTATMCYLYVGMVLRNEAGGICNKIVIACTSQNFILSIMSPIVSQRE